MIKMLQDRGFTVFINTRMENGRLSSTWVFYHNINCKMYISVGHLPSILWPIETINIPLTFPRTSKNIVIFLFYCYHCPFCFSNNEFRIRYILSTV